MLVSFILVCNSVARVSGVYVVLVKKHTVQRVLVEFVLNPVECVVGWVGARERICDLEFAHVARGVPW